MPLYLMIRQEGIGSEYLQHMSGSSVFRSGLVAHGTNESRRLSLSLRASCANRSDHALLSCFKPDDLVTFGEWERSSSGLDRLMHGIVGAGCTIGAVNLPIFLGWEVFRRRGLSALLARRGHPSY